MGPVEATVVATLVTGTFLLIVEIVKKRAPSREKEADQEDQWRKHLWEINRTLSADLAMSEKNYKETKRLQEKTEEECELLRRQNAQLQTAQAAWLIEREEMQVKIAVLEKDVYRLTTKVNQLERKQEEQNGGVK